MSELVPSLIELNKGLNLQTPKITAPPGTVLDTLNYEQVDFQGQKRIDGFTRYDGSLLSAIDEYYVVGLGSAFTGIINDLVAVEDGLLGVVVFVSGSTIRLAIIDETLLPVPTDELFVIQSDGTYGTGNAITSIATGTDTETTAEIHYTNLLAANAVLRTPVESLPGGVIGLHWFRDRLYAVADVTVVSLSGTTPTIYPNDELAIAGDTSKVLDALTLADTRVVFLATMNSDLWQVEDTAVTRDALSVGTIANGFQTLAVNQEIASFFESRNEQQVLDEDGPSGPYDFGWRFVDLGWKVKFLEGLSLYGSLVSLNQNLSGLGVQGPTSTTGNNGRPLLLTQNVTILSGNIDNLEQVNGWKSSQTPASYFLDPDNLTDIDSDYIYADAFFSWDGETGQIEMLKDSLVEYPANNTVEITL